MKTEVLKIYKGMCFKKGNVIYHINNVAHKDNRCEVTKIFTNRYGDYVTDENGSYNINKICEIYTQR